jgi:hypothetical protein
MAALAGPISFSPTPVKFDGGFSWTYIILTGAPYFWIKINLFF